MSDVRQQRKQKIEYVLLLRFIEQAESENHLVCFAANARVFPDSLTKVFCSSIMQEENALPQSP